MFSDTELLVSSLWHLKVKAHDCRNLPLVMSPKTTTKPQVRKKWNDFVLWYEYFPVPHVYLGGERKNTIQQELNIFFSGYLCFS